jgi:ribosomal protein S18 acetylase RimI-like enzyme
MNEIITTSPATIGIVPVPRAIAIATRLATADDLPFLDAMQKQHGKALGYFPTKQFEGYIEMGGVLIAHDGAEPVGYVISRDRYLKRDELGVVYQLCVKSGDQRKLVGATLVREVFERSAYGCKLYCCWCAQDLPANHFWESMGFVPIAFRAGSTGKRRVHIFWQRRINDGDTTTPYWYPSMTNQGAIREDRLVFPIPPGTHWSEVQAEALPSGGEACVAQIEGATSPAPTKKTPKPREQASAKPVPLSGALFFAPPAPPKQDKPAREKRPKTKVDPKLVAKARELRDRYLEHVNSEAHALRAIGKYAVGRLPDPTRDAKPIAMLPAA